MLVVQLVHFSQQSNVPVRKPLTARQGDLLLQRRTGDILGHSGRPQRSCGTIETGTVKSLCMRAVVLTLKFGAMPIGLRVLTT